MKTAKIFFIVILSGLFLTVGCESDNGDGESGGDGEDSQIIMKNKELTSTVDSLNTMLNSYEAEEKELSEKITVLQAKLSETKTPPSQEIKVVYKTKIKYKTDETVLADLENKKKKVLDQIDEINRLKEAIANKESKLDKMQTQVADLETKNEEMHTSDDVAIVIDSVLRGRLTVSDINVELLTRRIKDKKKKHLYIEIIETSFTVNENDIAEKGNKIVYICIIDKDKNVLHHEENNTFTDINGNTQFYTTKNQFAYEEEKLRLTVIWEKKELELNPGTYTTEFYIDNTISGIGTFNIE